MLFRSNHILFVGFQVGGTRGARLVEGEREVKIHGQWFEVRAQVSNIESYSAHADSNEMLAWLRKFRQVPSEVFICHGEAQASDAFRQRIGKELGWQARVPEHMERVEVLL